VDLLETLFEQVVVRHVPECNDAQFSQPISNLSQRLNPAATISTSAWCCKEWVTVVGNLLHVVSPYTRAFPIRYWYFTRISHICSSFAAHRIHSQVTGVAQRWVCVFEGRTGVNARAEFASKEEAMQCAERHARAVTPASIPLAWEGADERALARTPLGKYRVEAIS